MLTILGVLCVTALLIALAVLGCRFMYLSINTRYNPCTFNIYKDDYMLFFKIGMGHSFYFGIITLVQLMAHVFPTFISCHFNGSLQVVSLVPTLVYYHLMVINYKYRLLEVRHRGHADYTTTVILDVICGIAGFCLCAYAVGLLHAELSYPYGIYSPPKYDTSTGWSMENYGTLGIWATVIATIVMLGNLFRISRNAFRIVKEEPDYEQDNYYWFRKFISRNVEPHFINDFFFMFMPAQYFLVRVAPIITLNALDIIGKCFIIAHPLTFLCIYMGQIKLATLRVRENEMECRCCICQEKDRNRKTTDSWFIKLKIMRSRNNNAGEERREVGEAEAVEIGGAATTNVDEQPTETTPAMCTTTQIEESEDL